VRFLRMGEHDGLMATPFLTCFVSGRTKSDMCQNVAAYTVWICFLVLMVGIVCYQIPRTGGIIVQAKIAMPGKFRRLIATTRGQAAKINLISCVAANSHEFTGQRNASPTVLMFTSPRHSASASESTIPWKRRERPSTHSSSSLAQLC
jgi:hypothetical protein